MGTDYPAGIRWGVWILATWFHMAKWLQEPEVFTVGMCMFDFYSTLSAVDSELDSQNDL